MTQLFLLSQVATLLDRKPHQIAYALSSGNVEEPRLRIGNRRIFSESDVLRLADHFGVDSAHKTEAANPGANV